MSIANWNQISDLAQHQMVLTNAATSAAAGDAATLASAETYAAAGDVATLASAASAASSAISASATATLASAASAAATADAAVTTAVEAYAVTHDTAAIATAEAFATAADAAVTTAVEAYAVTHDTAAIATAEAFATAADIVVTAAVLAHRPWRPVDCVSGNCTLWLEAKYLNALVDGNAVATWTGLSGSANATASGTQKPLFKANIVNGLPALLWDNVDDTMTTTSLKMGTVIIAAKYTVANFDDFDGLFTSASSGEGVLLGNSASPDWYPTSITKYMDGAATGSAVTNAWHVFAGTDPGLNTNTWTIGQDRGFAGRVWTGYIYGVLCYDAILNAAELKRASQYFGDQVGAFIA